MKGFNSAYHKIDDVFDFIIIAFIASSVDHFDVNIFKDDSRYVLRRLLETRRRQSAVLCVRIRAHGGVRTPYGKPNVPSQSDSLTNTIITETWISVGWYEAMTSEVVLRFSGMTSAYKTPVEPIVIWTMFL